MNPSLSGQPSTVPSESPSVSKMPSIQPSMSPTNTGNPTSVPSESPSISISPSSQPWEGPSTLPQPRRPSHPRAQVCRWSPLRRHRRVPTSVECHQASQVRNQPVRATLLRPRQKAHQSDLSQLTGVATSPGIHPRLDQERPEERRHQAPRTASECILNDALMHLLFYVSNLSNLRNAPLRQPAHDTRSTNQAWTRLTASFATPGEQEEARHRRDASWETTPPVLVPPQPEPADGHRPKSRRPPDSTMPEERRQALNFPTSYFNFLL